MTGPATVIMTNRSTLPRLSSSLQSLIEDHDSIGFSPFLFIELLSQLARIYANIPQEQWMILKNLLKLQTNSSFFFNGWTLLTYLLTTSGYGWNYSNIDPLVNLRKRKLNRTGLFAQLCTVEFSFRIVISDPTTVTLSVDNYSLLIALHIPVHSSIQTILLYYFTFLYRRGESFANFIHCTWFSNPTVGPKCDPLWTLRPYCYGAQLQEKILTPFQKLWIICPINCLTTGRWYCYKKLDVLMTLKTVEGFALHKKTSREKSRLYF